MTSPIAILPEQNAILKALPPYVFAELDRLKAQARAAGKDFVDLGIGSPDIPTAPDIIEALVRAAREPSSHGYPPFRGVPQFFDAIGRFMDARFGVDIDGSREAIALSGAKEGIAQVIFSLCGKGDVVLVPSIYYPVYARAAWLSGADVRWMPLRAEQGFVPDLDAIPKEDLARAKILIVNYPNNPTGARVELAFYERAVAFAHEHKLILVSDLAYSELTFDGTPAPSALQVPGARDVCVEFHSFSKTFSMAGFRLGFAVGGAHVIDALAAYRTNVGYGTPTAIQLAGAYALDHRAAIVPQKVAEYRARRDAVVASFSSAGWNVTPPPAAMYQWLKVPAGVDDWDWVKTLLFEDGVVVTPGVAFGEGGAGYFRISLVRASGILADASNRIANRARKLTNK